MKRLCLVLGLLWYAAAVLLLYPFVIHAQTDNTFYVKQFAGSTVGQKTTAAQAACNPNTNVPCIIVFDPSLSQFVQGTMPTQCAQCIWQDFRTPHPPLQLSNVNGYRYVGAGYSLPQAVSDLSSSGGGTVYVPSSVTLTSPLTVGTSSAPVAIVLAAGGGITCNVASGTSCITLNNQSGISCQNTSGGPGCNIVEGSANRTTYLVTNAGFQSSIVLSGITLQGRNGGSTSQIINMDGLFDGTRIDNVVVDCFENGGVRIHGSSANNGNGPILITNLSVETGGCVNAGVPVTIDSDTVGASIDISWLGGGCEGPSNATNPCLLIHNGHEADAGGVQSITIQGVYFEAECGASCGNAIEINGGDGIKLSGLTFGGNVWNDLIHIDSGSNTVNVDVSNINLLSSKNGATINDALNNVVLNQSHVSHWRFYPNGGESSGSHQTWYRSNPSGNSWGGISVICDRDIFSTNSCYFGPELYASGTSPDLWIGGGFGGGLGFVSGATPTLKFNPSTHALYPVANNAYDLGQPGGNVFANVWANNFNDAFGRSAVMCSGAAANGTYCDGGTKTWTSIPAGPTFSAKSAHLGSASCSPAGGSYNTCTNTINWPSSFADSSYFSSCWGVNPTGSGSVALALYKASQTASSVTVTVQSLTSGSSLQYGDIECVGVHN